MFQLARGALAGLDGGFVQANKLAYLMFVVDLIAGSVVEPVNLRVSGAVVLCSRFAGGGALGHLSASYDPVTDSITVTSSSATDTSTVFVVVFYNA